MARKAKPWWWTQRGRWAATLDGKRVLAPPDIGKGDESAAWAWFHGLAGRPGAARSKARGWTVDELANAWLAWDAERLRVGDRAWWAHQTARSGLRRICGAVVAGVPFGLIPASDLTAGHLDALVRALATESRVTAKGRQVNPASPGHRRYLASLIKQVIAWSARDDPGRPRLIAENPIAAGRIPPCPKAHPRFASRDEAAIWMRHLWRSGDRDYARLQRVMIHTGARPQELADIRWSDINWRGHRSQSGRWMAVASLAKWKCSRKTGDPRRIYFPDRLCRMLKRLRDRAEDKSGFVWRTPTGKQWSGPALCTATRKRVRAAIQSGVEISGEGPDRLVNYRWRHTAASTLCMAGVPVPIVAELLGTSVAQITSTYAHMLSSHVADAASRLASSGRQQGQGGQGQQR